MTAGKVAASPGKPRVFITYSRHDNEVERISALRKWLYEIAKGEVVFVIDQDLTFGDNISLFENSIEMYDYIIIAGTRKYKEKVESGGFGVAREFKLILERSYLASVKIFPIVLEGEYKDVFPLGIPASLAANMSGLAPDRNHGGISSLLRTKYGRDAKAIVEAIRSDFAFRKKDPMKLDRYQMIKDKLLFDLKYEDVSEKIDSNLLDHIFVKTSFYYAVKEKGAYILVGRKGSGKSFLADHFARHPVPSDAICCNIHFREFRLLVTHSFMKTSRISNDLDSIFYSSEVFEIIWTTIFMVATIAYSFASVRSQQIEYDVDKLAGCFNLLKDCGAVDSSTRFDGYILPVQAVCDWCAEKVLHHLDAQIQSLDGDMASVAAKLALTVQKSRVIASVLKFRVIDEYRKLYADKRMSFLITVDGFDTKFDMFRKQTNLSSFTKGDKESRVRFEINWLIGLIQATFNLTSASSRLKLPGMEQADVGFLVTLPRDRFIEAQRSDRDAYRTTSKQVDIRWSGPELMLMIRKRLEIYYHRSANRAAPLEQLKESLSWIGDVPSDLRFKHNGKDVIISTFTYILRHSFWRPRDILHHIVDILWLSETSNKRQKKIEVETIRTCVRDASARIVSDEFFGEFGSIFPKIREYINIFRKCELEMSFDILYSIVSGSEIRLSSGDVISSEMEMIDFLYEIGFLGIVPREEDQRMGFRRREAFSFSDPLNLYERLDSDQKSKSKWVIHPIFSETLLLDTRNCPFLLEYDESYILRE